MTRLFFYALAVMLLVITLHACDLNILEAEDPYPEGKANVRVVHIAPEAGTIKYFHGDQIPSFNEVISHDPADTTDEGEQRIYNNVDALAFQHISDYVQVPVGRTPDGFLNEDGDTLIVRDVMDGRLAKRFFDYERNFTVFALHGGTGNVHIRSMEIEPTPNAKGQVRMRVLHAVSGAPAVDIYLTEPGESISDENLFLFDIGFNNEGGDAGTAPSEMPLYFPSEPGTYDVKVTVSQSSDVIFSQEVVLEASRNYTMVIFPTETNDGIDRLMLLPDN